MISQFPKRKDRLREIELLKSEFVTSVNCSEGIGHSEVTLRDNERREKFKRMVIDSANE